VGVFSVVCSLFINSSIFLLKKCSRARHKTIRHIWLQISNDSNFEFRSFLRQYKTQTSSPRKMAERGPRAMVAFGDWRFVLSIYKIFDFL
jgi:hypothetical protein